MRCKLDKAQETVMGLEQSVRTAERDLNVSRMDIQSVNVTLASSVQKIQNLLDTTSSMRTARSHMLKGIKAARKRQIFRTQVYVRTTFVFRFL